MSTTAYFQRAVPEPFRILGLRLLPLSLGRYRLMKRFDIAFVAEESAKANPDDLILGVLICANRCDDFKALANSKNFSKVVGKWGKKANPKLWLARIPFLGKWWRKRYGFDFLEKVGLFQCYIKEASEIPQFFDESNGGGSSGSHWSHGIEVALRQELGWSKDEIDEEPLSKAMADYFKLLENQGAIRLLTPEDIIAGEANAKIFAALEQAARN